MLKLPDVEISLFFFFSFFFPKPDKPQSQTGGAGSALCQFATLTSSAKMKGMGFYVNCLSAESHIDPFLRTAAATCDGVRRVARLFVYLSMSV